MRTMKPHLLATAAVALTVCTFKPTDSWSFDPYPSVTMDYDLNVLGVAFDMKQCMSSSVAFYQTAVPILQLQYDAKVQECANLLNQRSPLILSGVDPSNPDLIMLNQQLDACYATAQFAYKQLWIAQNCLKYLQIQYGTQAPAEDTGTDSGLSIE